MDDVYYLAKKQDILKEDLEQFNANAKLLKYDTAVTCYYFSDGEIVDLRG